MITRLKPLRTLAMLATVGLLAACANGAQLGEERGELENFRLCYNIVTTNDAVQGPLSREADLDVFSDLIRAEVDRRFGRYDGDRLYHIAIHIDAYVLAVPGVPLVASPRSALIMSVNVWDDAAGEVLNDEHKQMTVLESLSGSSVVGSGLTQSAEEQMQTLSQNAAIRIENWLVENPQWFETAADEAEAASDTDAEATDEAVGEAAGDDAAEDDALAEAPRPARAASEDRCAQS
ncbi:hypothetical protein [Pararhodobacter oceanensis]|uniref:hypothetical protein n=1 Tax=Pararhodobacter oceanensis TaxID=2172121 RepID=UPI003A92F56C